ncbi:MAG TPA: hypothetical protein VEG28_03115, partial [Dehalococcoidia bacterium]|nr:hypothetical protein [Dehalococcoidia bacterium]
VMVLEIVGNDRCAFRAEGYRSGQQRLFDTLETLRRALCFGDGDSCHVTPLAKELCPLRSP